MTFEPFRELLNELARVSGQVIVPFFANHELGLELKADQTPVTVADRRAEEVMRELIRQRFPAHGVLGEEFGHDNPGAEFTWVLDPIDGTKAFATACPLFGTLIGLLHHDRPILGCIHQPVLGQLLVGDGKLTTLNGQPVRIRECRDLAEATLLFTSFYAPEKTQDGRAFAALTRRVRLARTWGDCYGYFLLSTGWADIACDPIMHPWDILPIIPVVEGAGGRISDWQGNDPVRPGVSSSVAAHPSLHEAVIRALNP